MKHPSMVIASLALAAAMFAAASVTSRSGATASRAGSSLDRGGGVADERAAAQSPPRTQAAPGAPRRNRPHPPRFISEIERALVESPIARPTAPPRYDGVGLTADEEKRVQAMQQAMVEEIVKARAFMTDGNQDRARFRAAIKAARDEYRANLVATLGQEKADKLRALIMARGEAGGLAQVRSSLEAPADESATGRSGPVQ